MGIACDVVEEARQHARGVTVRVAAHALAAPTDDRADY
jgi:hypothetical protein